MEGEIKEGMMPSAIDQNKNGMYLLPQQGNKNVSKGKARKAINLRTRQNLNLNNSTYFMYKDQYRPFLKFVYRREEVILR